MDRKKSYESTTKRQKPLKIASREEERPFENSKYIDDNRRMKNDCKSCKISSEDWNDNKKAIRDRVRNASFICSKCFRVSNDEKLLCKPKKIR